MNKYRPSNATEGDSFIARFCAHCQRSPGNRNLGGPHGCEIIEDSMLWDVEDHRYPSELTSDERGPVCTAFLPEGEVFTPRCPLTGELFGETS